MILDKEEIKEQQQIRFDRFKNIKNIAEDFYLEYFNNYLTISLIAEHYEISDELASELVNLGRKINN